MNIERHAGKLICLFSELLVWVNDFSESKIKDFYFKLVCESLKKEIEEEYVSFISSFTDFIGSLGEEENERNTE